MSDVRGEGSEDFEDNDDWMRDLELLRGDWLSNDDNFNDFRPNFIRESDEEMILKMRSEEFDHDGFPSG